MLQEKIEERWINLFADVFTRCGLQAGDSVAVLAESQSRPINVQLCSLAAQRLGARSFEIIVPSPALQSTIPIRSTGASNALQNQNSQNSAPVLAALSCSTLVADCTVEGLLHAPELPHILKGGARVLMVSNEHPEILERCKPAPECEIEVKAAMKKLRAAKQMRVTSKAGSDLTIDLNGAVVGGGWGTVARPGLITHWPGGLVLAFPNQKTVNGRLVLNVGDVNLTFKRYLENRIVLTFENDYITKIEGENVDAEMMRGYMAAWGDKEAYAISHLGWGLNRQARWDAMQFYDKRDFNGTELRAFAGNFLFSTGANEVAGRHTLGHFDIPMKHCTVELDGLAVVKDGVLL